jgi:hypothetical protein
MVGWPLVFGPIVNQYIMAEAHGRTKLLLTSWWLESKKRERKWWYPNISFKGTPSVTFHQAPPPKGSTTSQ